MPNKVYASGNFCVNPTNANYMAGNIVQYDLDLDFEKQYTNVLTAPSFPTNMIAQHLSFEGIETNNNQVVVIGCSGNKYINTTVVPDTAFLTRAHLQCFSRNSNTGDLTSSWHKTLELYQYQSDNTPYGPAANPASPFGYYRVTKATKSTTRQSINSTEIYVIGDVEIGLNATYVGTSTPENWVQQSVPSNSDVTTTQGGTNGQTTTIVTHSSNSLIEPGMEMYESTFYPTGGPRVINVINSTSFQVNQQVNIFGNRTLTFRIPNEYKITLNQAVSSVSKNQTISFKASLYGNGGWSFIQMDNDYIYTATTGSFVELKSPYYNQKIYGVYGGYEKNSNGDWVNKSVNTQAVIAKFNITNGNIVWIKKFEFNGVSKAFTDLKLRGDTLYAAFSGYDSSAAGDYNFCKINTLDGFVWNGSGLFTSGNLTVGENNGNYRDVTSSYTVTVVDSVNDLSVTPSSGTTTLQATSLSTDASSNIWVDTSQTIYDN